MLRYGILSSIRSCSIQSSRFYRDKKTYAGDEAGFRRQKKEFGDLWEDDPESIYEADFSKAPNVMREHENEMERHREKVKLKMIERKYFRIKKQPSFLTWAEKEQIRHLHQQDPEEWNIERLSESFPATVDTILKIIKAKWTPNNMKRVRTHDESIKKNWEAFKANKLENMDPELKEHLSKFSQRKFNSSENAYALSKNDQIEFKFPKPRHQEFSHIISSCKPLMKAKEITKNSEQIEAGENGSSVMVSETSVMQQKVELPKKLRLRNMTFAELQKKLGTDKKNADEDDFHVSFPKEPNSVKSLNTHGNINHDVGLEDFEEIDLNYSQHPNELSEIEEPKLKKYAGKEVDAKSLTNSDEPVPFIDKIVIPPEVRKKGAMYQVSDCFYDDKGDLLFRVPGYESV